MEIIITLIILSIAAITDLKYKIIPNILTLPAIVLGLIYNFYYFGWVGLKDSFLGCLLGIALLIIPFALRAMGGGDVKLLAAVGAINGVHFTLWAFLVSAIVGGVLALGYSLFKGKLKGVLFNVLLSLNPLNLKNISKSSENNGLVLGASDLSIPYGVAIFAGTILTYFINY